jgi:hypothetical protein
MSPETARIVRIKNTLELHRIWVSPELLEEVNQHKNLSVVGVEKGLAFDASGRLLTADDC